jgi:hypothetical protein
MRKDLSDIAPDDFRIFPVWEFTNEDEISETMLRAIEDLPVSSLSGRIIGTQVVLANGSYVPAFLMNVSLDNPRHNEQFITLNVFTNSKVFQLARYFDPWYDTEGPDALAKVLGLDISDVFPIAYDIGANCVGDPASLRNSFLIEPRVRLSNDEIMRMAVKRRE